MRVPKHTLTHQTSGQSLLSYQAHRLAPHFSQVVLLTGNFVVDTTLPGQKVVDPADYVGAGPLAGLLAAMRIASTPWVALLAIDQPAVPVQHFERALGAAEEVDQIIVSADEDERIQWLSGLYRVSLKAELERQMAEGVRAVKRFGQSVNVKIVKSQEKDAFINLNTPEEAIRHGWAISD